LVWDIALPRTPTGVAGWLLGYTFVKFGPTVVDHCLLDD